MKQAALPMIGLPPSVLLEDRHYLGRSHRAKLTWQDDFGVMVFAAPSSRNLPKDWLELVRWCLTGGPNSGSQQWRNAASWLRTHSDATTVVSYSDPSVGHTGALYRACGWLWAPTWHRLFPPPTGQGQWTTAEKIETVKDRWVALLRPDDNRAAALTVNDGRIRRMAWAEYREPRWKRGIVQHTTGGGDYKRWIKNGDGPCKT